jgi:hypothetical protein
MELLTADGEAARDWIRRRVDEFGGDYARGVEQARAHQHADASGAADEPAPRERPPSGMPVL